MDDPSKLDLSEPKPLVEDKPKSVSILFTGFLPVENSFSYSTSSDCDGSTEA